MKQLAESEVSIKSLIGVFESAFMKVLDEAEDSFWVQGESLKTKLTLDVKRKYLKFSIIYVMSKNLSLTEATFIVNKVNDENILTRFVAAEFEGKIYICSNYYMTFEEGLVVFHLIKITKQFEIFTVNSLREYFNDYI